MMGPTPNFSCSLLSFFWLWKGQSSFPNVPFPEYCLRMLVWALLFPFLFCLLGHWAEEGSRAGYLTHDTVAVKSALGTWRTCWEDLEPPALFGGMSLRIQQSELGLDLGPSLGLFPFFLSFFLCSLGKLGSRKLAPYHHQGIFQSPIQKAFYPLTHHHSTLRWC